jgi:carbonic anhydrase
MPAVPVRGHGAPAVPVGAEMAKRDPGCSAVTRRGFFGAASGASLAATGVLAGAAVTGAAVTGAAVTGVTAASASPLAEDVGRPGPDEALRILLAGNQRWACGQAEHPRQSVWWRHHLAAHQEPFAVVLSCIDSRVPPEIVFDCGLGDMFVVRTGAQTLDRGVVLGSVEYGPQNYHSARLILVLGHSGCGAVSAAIEVISSGGRAPGHIQAVVDALRPAYHVAVREPGDLLDNMIRAQTRLTAGRLRRDRLLARLIATEGLRIAGGHYDLETGLVTMVA